MQKIIIWFIFLLWMTQLNAQNLVAIQNLPKEIKSSSTFIIETIINKGAISGFIKLSQLLPSGFTAEELDSKEGEFTFNEEGVKIIWTSPPKDSIYTVLYKVKAPAQINGSIDITGKIAYIDGNARKMFVFPKQVLNYTNLTAPDSTLKEVIPELPIEAGQHPVNAVSQIPIGLHVPTTAIAGIPNKTYKVQIGAFASEPQIDGVPEISTLVLENGITKYFSGNFLNYEDANKRKNILVRKGFLGAFIVSFQDGKIIK